MSHGTEMKNNENNVVSLCQTTITDLLEVSCWIVWRREDLR